MALVLRASHTQDWIVMDLYAQKEASLQGLGDKGLSSAVCEFRKAKPVRSFVTSQGTR